MYIPRITFHQEFYSMLLCNITVVSTITVAFLALTLPGHKAQVLVAENESCYGNDGLHSI